MTEGMVIIGGKVHVLPLSPYSFPGWHETQRDRQHLRIKPASEVPSYTCLLPGSLMGPSLPKRSILWSTYPDHSDCSKLQIDDLATSENMSKSHRVTQHGNRPFGHAHPCGSRCPPELVPFACDHLSLELNWRTLAALGIHGFHLLGCQVDLTCAQWSRCGLNRGPVVNRVQAILTLAGRLADRICPELTLNCERPG